jgi:hypothetical protein
MDTSSLIDDEALRRAMPTVAGCRGLVITGVPRAGKSSLAFQAAVDHARRGRRVVVLCQQAAMYAKMPRPQRDVDELGEATLVLIEFVYVAGLTDVRRHCAANFDHDPTAADGGVPFPSLVVVEDDGLDDAADRLEATKTIACVDAAVAWARDTLPAAAGAAAGAAAASSFVYVSNAPFAAPPATLPLMVARAAPLRLTCVLDDAPPQRRAEPGAHAFTATLECDVAPVPPGLPVVVRYAISETALTVASIA